MRVVRARGAAQRQRDAPGRSSSGSPPASSASRPAAGRGSAEPRGRRARALGQLLVEAVQLRAAAEQRHPSIAARRSSAARASRDRAHDLAREAVEHRVGARERSPTPAPSTPCSILQRSASTRRAAALLRDRVGDRAAGHGTRARRDGRAVAQQRRASSSRCPTSASRRVPGSSKTGVRFASTSALGLDRCAASQPASAASRAAPTTSCAARARRRPRCGCARGRATSQSTKYLVQIERHLLLDLEGHGRAILRRSLERERERGASRAGRRAAR